MAAAVGERWRERAGRLRAEVHALYLACRDPRVPWYAKALAAIVVAYALSPIDLIPDFVPVLGYLDDLVLVPLGVLAVRALVPRGVMEDCRARARSGGARPRSRAGLAIVVGVWVALAVVGVWLAIGLLGGGM